MSIGGWISCGMLGFMAVWIAYLTWAEYRNLHPKDPPKGSNIKGPLN